MAPNTTWGAAAGWWPRSAGSCKSYQLLVSAQAGVAVGPHLQMKQGPPFIKNHCTLITPFCCLTFSISFLPGMRKVIVVFF